MKLFLTILFSFGCLGAWSQEVSTVVSDQTALDFVKKYYKGDDDNDWSHFHLTKGDEWANIYNVNPSAVSQITAAEKYSKWAVADFNEDKKMDLIVSGYMPDENGDRRYMLLVFLSKNRNEYVAQNLVQPNQEAYPWYFSRLEKDTISPAAIVVTRWVTDMAMQDDSELPLHRDTLVNKYDYFINYNPRPEENALEDITYTSASNGYKVFINKLSSSKMVDILLTVSNKKGNPTVIKARMKNDVCNELLTLINNAALQKNAHGHTGRFDTENDKLAITLWDQKVITVINQQTAYPYTMNAIYSWLQDLVDNIYGQYNSTWSRPYSDDF